MKTPFYITIGGAYADTKLVTPNLSKEDWDSWTNGETDITKVASHGCFEPCGINKWIPIRKLKTLRDKKEN